MIINIIILLIFLLSVIYAFKYKFKHLLFIKPSMEALKDNSSYTAFLLSLGSHIGAGNILGVTTALILGGPGTLFWMIICTIFTTIFAFMENTLGLKYKVKIDDESRGGSPYYILYGLKKNKLATFFSVILVLSSTIFFLPIQVRGVTYSIKELFGLNEIIIFLFLLLFSIIFIFKGTNTITKIINKIVPIMTICFLVVCLYALINKYYYIDDVIKLILKDAFTFKSSFMSMMIIGLKRSLFSNEAGLGTAPSINCYSNNKPIKQGYLQVLTCFIDTVVMCVLLGVVVLLYDIDLYKNTGEQLAIQVFEYILGTPGKYCGILLLFFFSLATIISSYYAGESNMLFNVINNKKRTNICKLCYKLLFIIGIILGVFLENNGIWNLVDYGLIILGIINIVVITSLAKDFESELI